MIIKRTLKWSAIASIVLFLLASSGVIIYILSGIPHQKIQAFLQRELSHQLKREVSIGPVKGDLLGTLVITNVAIANQKLLKNGPIITCSEIRIQYSLFNLIRYKDLIGLVKSISIKNANIHLIRQTNDHINLIDMVLSIIPNQPSKNTLIGNNSIHISLEQSRVIYDDYRGFGPTVLSTPNQSIYDHISGKANIKRSLVHFSANALIHEPQTTKTVRVNGNMNLNSGKFHLECLGDKWNVNYWAPHYVTIPGLQFGKGTADLRLTLTNRVLNQKDDLPFHVNIALFPNNLSIKTPWIRPWIKQLNGKFEFSNEGLFFDDLFGTIANQRFQMQGSMTVLSPNQYNIDIIREKFEISTLPEFFPTFSTWLLKGTGTLRLHITDQNNSINISGNIIIPTGEVYTHPIQNSIVRFNYKPANLSIDIPQFTCYSGQGQATGTVVFPNNEAQSPSLNFTGDLMHMSLKQLFKNSSLVTGNINHHVIISGPANAFKIEDRLGSINAAIAGQPIHKSQVHIRRTEAGYKILPTTFINVANPLWIQGFLNNQRKFNLSLNGKRCSLHNHLLIKSINRAATLNVSIKGDITGIWNTTLTQQPLNNLHSNLQLTLHDIKLGSTALGTGSAMLHINNGILSFEDIAIIKNDEVMNGSLQIDKYGVRQSRFSVVNTNIESFRYFSDYLPTSYKTMYGVLNFSGQLNRMTLNPNAPFFEKYSLIGQGDMSKATLLQQNIDSLAGEVTYAHNLLRIKNGFIKHQRSKINFESTYYNAKDFLINIQPNSKVDFHDFQGLIEKYGDIQGLGTFSGQYQQRNGAHFLSLHIDVLSPVYNQISFDQIKGNFTLSRNMILFDGLNFSRGNDSYNLNGNVMIPSLQTNKVASDNYYNYDIKVSITQGNLETLKAIYDETKRVKIGQPKQRTTINDSQLKILHELVQTMGTYYQQHADNLPIYRINDRPSLASYQQKITATLKPSLSLAEIRRVDVKGKIAGEMQVKKQANEFRFTSDFVLKEGQFGALTFNKLTFKAFTQNQGNQLRVSISDGAYGDVPFKSADAALFIDQDYILTINKFDMQAAGYTASDIISGTIPLAAIWNDNNQTPINLSFHFPKDTIGLLAMFNKSIEWMSNDGEIVLRLTGTMRHPILNSQKIDLINAKIKLSKGLYLLSPFNIEQSDIAIKNNQISIYKLNFSWKGEDTSQKENQFSLYGTIALKDLTLIDPEKLTLHMNLFMENTQLKLNFPKLYSGDIILKNINLEGPLIIPFSIQQKTLYHRNILSEKEIGPYLRGSISIKNGAIPIPETKLYEDRLSILLDLTAIIGADVFINGGAYTSGVSRLINNVDLEIEETKSPLTIKGSLNTIDLETEIRFKNGNISMFNRTFSMMDKLTQKQFYARDPSRVRNNLVRIQMKPDPQIPEKRRMKPFFEIAALTQVDKTIAVSSNSQATTNITTIEPHYFTFLMNGIIDDPTSFSLEHYKQEKNQYILVGDPYNFNALNAEQVNTITTLLVPSLLKPEFYQQLLSAGLSSGATNQVVRDISESQINLIVASNLRPIEKEIAKNIGLYDFKLEHNFGKDLTKMMGLYNNVTVVDDPKIPLASMQSVINLLDKLYIKVRTNIDQDVQNRIYKVNLISEYELTYLLNEWLSLNYGNRNLNYDDQMKGTFSLDANYRF